MTDKGHIVDRIIIMRDKNTVLIHCFFPLREMITGILLVRTYTQLEPGVSTMIYFGLLESNANVFNSIVYLYNIVTFT